MSEESLIHEYSLKHNAIGEYKFYKLLLTLSLKKLIAIEKGSFKGMSPEIELLGMHDKILILYRRTGEEIYLDMAKTFRKAAHKIYRVMLKRKLISSNDKFLNLV